MRLNLIWVGKTRNQHINALVDDYLKRLQRFVVTTVSIVKESRAATFSEILQSEAQAILKAIRDDSLVVLLDLQGVEWSSNELAEQLGKWEMRGIKEASFVIGGHMGVSNEVKERADICWSLSKLTLTHEMARLIETEQIYRAYTILRGHPYQK
jgi:23S rRNA (pseudouridine1915-N3)-methyltransferase